MFFFSQTQKHGTFSCDKMLQSPSQGPKTIGFSREAAKAIQATQATPISQGSRQSGGRCYRQARWCGQCLVSSCMERLNYHREEGVLNCNSNILVKVKQVSTR